jgi:EAL domain-containing protein (putative c-di-GMP-specific phosphodiesterase class I)/GGDEF domain-containing protein
LADTGAIPVLVLSRQQDPVEIVNSTLRNAGHPVHCGWVRDLQGLGEALSAATPQLLFLCVADAEEARAALETRSRYATHTPAILVRESISDADLLQAVELGAQDVVTLSARSRLAAVATRELRASRLDGALAGTLASARQYREQMRAFMTGSADAIAHVQEGIVVDVNPAWAELFGQQDATALLGQPLMDSFHPRSQAPLKGALVAAAQGRWTDHSLGCVAVLPDGAELNVDLEFERFEFEGEPAVRLRVPTQRRDLKSLTEQLEDALRLDAATGLLRRTAFLQQAASQLAHAPKAGLRALVSFEPDKIPAMVSELGPLAVEDVIEQLGALLRERLQHGDAAARLTGQGYSALVERGNARDLDAWIGQVLEQVAEHVFQAGRAHTASLTCSAGAVVLDAHATELVQPLEQSVVACRAAAASGGNRLFRPDSASAATDDGEADRTWAAQIKSALMANRFRLVQQPIASLLGEGEDMFDLVVRMLDDKGNEVLPSEFLAAAERTDLMKNIDRWVVGAAMSFCATRRPNRVFVRVSRDSLRDQTLGAWLHQQIRASGVEPSRVVIEVAEDLATRNLKEARELRSLVTHLGFGFAIENFGSGRDSAQMLKHLPSQFVKIDGSLMQGLAGNPTLQGRVRELVEQAKASQAVTIAERVEDANTMAVLWQLGVEFVQGYFVSAPEEVVLGA